MAADFKALGKNEQGALVAGALSILLSFFSSYVRVKVDGGSGVPGLNISSGTSAWTSWGTLGMLLIVVATAIVAIKAFAPDMLPDGVPWSLAAVGAAGLGTVLLILRAFTVGGGGIPGVSVGPGWSGWVLFITAIALTVFTFLAFKASGEKMPDMNKKGTPPAGPSSTPPA